MKGASLLCIGFSFGLAGCVAHRYSAGSQDSSGTADDRAFVQSREDSVTPAEQEWIDKIPSDLKPRLIAASTPEDINRGSRLSDLYLHPHFERTAHSATGYIERLAERSSTLDDAALVQVRSIVRQGPVRFDFQAQGNPQDRKLRAMVMLDMPMTLLQSSSRELLAGNHKAAIEDIGLAAKYERELPVAQVQMVGGQLINEVAAMVKEILDRKLMKPAELAELTMAIPTPDQIANAYADEEKNLFEYRVRQLSKMRAPRTDLILSEPLYTGEHPRSQVKVPPFGTLDKAATFALMCKIERFDLKNLVRTDGRVDEGAVKLVAEQRKSLPHLDRIYRASDVSRAQSEVKPYADAMNREPNSLGRESLMAREVNEFGYTCTLLQKYSAAYHCLQIASKS